MKIQIFSLEKFNDTKRVIRSRKSKKERKHNDQKKKDKWTNNVLTERSHFSEYNIAENVCILKVKGYITHLFNSVEWVIFA
jgi:hypothetical protein